MNILWWRWDAMKAITLMARVWFYSYNLLVPWLQHGSYSMRFKIAETFTCFDVSRKQWHLPCEPEGLFYTIKVVVVVVDGGVNLQITIYHRSRPWTYIYIYTYTYTKPIIIFVALGLQCLIGCSSWTLTFEFFDGAKLGWTIAFTWNDGLWLIFGVHSPQHKTKESPGGFTLLSSWTPRAIKENLLFT